MIRPLARAGLMLALLAGLSCSEPFAPAEFTGVYGWRGIRTVSLSVQDTVWVVADTFMLRPDGSGVWRTSTQTRPPGTLRAEVVHMEWPLDFVVEGRAVGILPTCPMSTDCAAIGYPRRWYDHWGTGALVSRDPPQVIYERSASAMAP